MKKNLLFIIASVILYISTSYAQAPYWKLNGNPNFGTDLVNLGNNFLGTALGNNTPIRLGTQGRQRIYIDNTLNGISGNVGIGTVFSTSTRPFSNLHIQQDNNNPLLGGGFRPWMQPSAQGSYSGSTGIMISNGDNIFLGLRNKGGIFDANDAILNWGDNGV